MCQYCGARLPQPVKSDRGAIFQTLLKSPQYAQSHSPQRHARLPKVHALHKAFTYGFFILFVGVALFIFVMLLAVGGLFGFFGSQVGGGPGAAFGAIPLVMSLVPLSMAAVGVFLFVTMRKRIHAVETSPVVALPVLVVDKRTHVSGGGDDSSARTTYYVTCETEDGNRLEYHAWDGNLYGRMAPQDAGIVYLRADCALDFDRVPV